MTKTTACMLCGREPPFEFQITRERDKESNPDRRELEIHIKRKHSMDEIQKFLNPSEFNKKKAKAKSRADKEEEGEEQEQEAEGEEAVKTDDLVAELFEKSGSGETKTTKTRTRSRRSKSIEPDTEEDEKPEANE